jgi:hypothetical protein
MQRLRLQNRSARVPKQFDIKRESHEVGKMSKPLRSRFAVC